MSSEQHSTNHVFLVDDHPLVCQGIAAVLSQAGFVISGKAGNSTETLEHPQLLSANLAIVDLALGEEDGLKLIPTLRAQGILVLVYTMYEEPSRVTGALEAGATGYVTKREVGQYLVEAVRKVLDGELFLSPRAAAGLAKQAANQNINSPSLSKQQKLVYRMLGEGASATEIAAELDVSPRTVESYCARMIEKLDLNGMKELRRQAISDRSNG